MTNSSVLNDLTTTSRWVVRPCPCGVDCTSWRVTGPNGRWAERKTREDALAYVPADERDAALRDLEGAEQA